MITGMFPNPINVVPGDRLIVTYKKGNLQHVETFDIDKEATYTYATLVIEGNNKRIILGEASVC